MYVYVHVARVDMARPFLVLVGIERDVCLDRNWYVALYERMIILPVSESVSCLCSN